MAAIASSAPIRASSRSRSKNLRYPLIDDEFDDGHRRGGGDFPFASELCFLYGLATALWEARGKGEMEKTDFLFYVDRGAEGEHIRILPVVAARHRTASSPS